jgi:hypothetical protein
MADLFKFSLAEDASSRAIAATIPPYVATFVAFVTPVALFVAIFATFGALMAPFVATLASFITPKALFIATAVPYAATLVPFVASLLLFD